MKNIFKSLMFVGLLSFAACEDKSGLDNWFEKPAEVNTLELSITEGAVDAEGKQNVVIGPENQFDKITFSWTEALPPTEDYYITSYQIRVNVNGGDGADYVSEKLPASARSFTVSKREIYKFMFANWAYRFGNPTDMKVSILANIEGGQFYYKPVKTTIDFQMTPNEIPAMQFYLVGDANPNGSSAGDGIPITMRELDLFYQTGAVNEGSGQSELILNPNSTFIISFQNTSEYPAYVCGDKLTGTIDGTQIPVDGYKMVYVKDATEAAKYQKFQTLDAYVDGSHGKKNNYAISIENDDMANPLTGNIYIGRYSTQPAWVVGDAVTGSWSHQRMSWNYKAPDMVYREAHWFDRVSSPAGGGDKQGAFKIHGGANWSDPSWRPVQHAIDPAAPNANFGVTSNSGGDPKWVLNEGSDGDYRLELYNADMRINFVKLN